MRALTGSKEGNMLIDFNQAECKNMFFIISEGDHKRTVEIRMMELHSKGVSLDEVNQIIVENVGRQYGLKINFTAGEDAKACYSELIVIEDKGKVFSDKTYKESLYIGYIPSGKMQVNLNEMLSVIIKNKMEQSILDALRIIETKIKDIQLVDNTIMVDVGYATRLPINVLGDGVRKVLTIILSILACSNGMLLIDKIGNGLCYPIMSKLWKVILKTCKDFKVQLFTSTHSIETIKPLVKAIDETTESIDTSDSKVNIETLSLPINAFKLIKKEDDTLVALKYGPEQLSYIVEQEIEIM